MSAYARWDADDLVVLCHLQPGAKRSEFVGTHGDRLKIRLNAPPVDGKANSQLIAFLSKAFGVNKNAVLIESGELSRQKRVRIIAPQKLPNLLEFAHLNIKQN
ncbi:MAG: YggU family protein [Gammaproteobacteria bacterium]|nr:YggU family protein [Gammaproteobacteria bacterium]